MLNSDGSLHLRKRKSSQFKPPRQPRHTKKVTIRTERRSSLTWHQSLALARDLVALGFEWGDDDGAGVAVVVIVQDGGLCVVAVVVGGSGLHCVGAVVAGTVRLGRIVHRHATDNILPLL